MIRFVAGFGTIVAAVGAAEGSAGLGLSLIHI